MPKSFYAWDDMLTMNKVGFFPYTPATQMIYALNEGIAMLHEEGLDNVFARHARLGEATRRAVKTWGLENLNKNEKQVSPTITAILMPEGFNADQLRALCLSRFNVSLGGGLGPLNGQVFRIGHLGDLNEPMVLGTLATVELAMQVLGVPHAEGGVGAAIKALG